MKKFALIVAIGSIALSLTACGKTTEQIVNTPVSTVKAQQTIDFLQSTNKAVLRGELIYLNQRPCTLPGSPPPPLCASYAVGLQMKRLDDKAATALTTAQDAVEKLGDNPAAIDAAIAAAKIAVDEFKNFTNGYVKVAQ